MHMSDALITPSVAITMGSVSLSCLVASIIQIKKQKDNYAIPLMGVMGAFIFAAQMINFSIPGTGSSGHIIGGILLSALLGPWRAFITLASVLTIQCLIFADGGLLALGCNLFNMGVCACFIAYPLVFCPIMHNRFSAKRLLLASTLSCFVGLELGALSVTLETYYSGISSLPLSKFLLFMLPIHAVIGICEGVATAGVLGFAHHSQPELWQETSWRNNEKLSINNNSHDNLIKKSKKSQSKTIIIFLSLALLMAGSFYWVASSMPDGLEWAISQTTNNPEISDPSTQQSAHIITEKIQETTAIFPDYERATDGIIGVILVISVLWIGLSTLNYLRRKNEQT